MIWNCKTLILNSCYLLGVTGLLHPTTTKIRTTRRSCSTPQKPSTLVHLANTKAHDNVDETRNEFLKSISALSLSALLIPSLPCNGAEEEPEMKVFQMKSGVKYLELEEGTGPTPKYGQLCSISYKGYIKLPANKNDANPKAQQFDQASAYLIKHGNGRTIAGLDEGLHTLRVGGSRRIIIPPKLGYVSSGIGPLPEYPWDRMRLNNLLDQMVAVRGGTVVFEVTLNSAIDDEADQGYYEDSSLTPEEFEQIRNKIQEKAAQASTEEQG